jgi:hypothetical protein
MRAIPFSPVVNEWLAEAEEAFRRQLSAFSSSEISRAEIAFAES